MKRQLLEAAPQGAVNLHGGYLPDFLGVFSPFWNLLKGATHAGCTVHFVNEDIDAGAILKREQFPVAADDTLLSLYEKITRHGVTLLVTAFSEVEDGTFRTIRNSSTPENYNSFPSRDDRARFHAAGHKVLSLG